MGSYGSKQSQKLHVAFMYAIPVKLNLVHKRVLLEDVCKHCRNCVKTILHIMGMPRTQFREGIKLLMVVLLDHTLLKLHGISATHHEGREEPRTVCHNSLDHLVLQKHDPN